MSVGKLVVELSASVGKFQSDMGRAAAIAEQNAKKIERAIGGIKNTIVGIGSGLGAAFSFNEAVGFIKETVAAAAALDDLADASGSTVENLSQLKNVVTISGGSFEQLETLILKVGKGIAGIDDESGKAAKALAFLGVKAKDPAQAVQELAKKLDQFADGPGKIALAVDLLGKEGARLLPILKDIAQTSDVFATVTTKQAQDAEALEKAWRRLGVEAVGLKNAILSDLVPALSQLLREFTDGIKIAGGFWAAIANFGTINPFQSIDDNLAETRKKIADVQSNTGAAAKWANVLGASDDVLDRLKKREQFLLRQKQLVADAKFGASNADARDLRLETNKPQLPYKRSNSTSKAAREEVSEYDKIIEKLEKDAAAADLALREAFSTEEITAAQKALAQLRADSSWKKLTEDQRENIKNRIASIDAIQRETSEWKRRREEIEKQIKAEQDLQKQQEEAVARSTQSIGQYAESNKVLAAEIDLLGKDDEARSKMIETMRGQLLINEAIASGDAKNVEIARRLVDERIKIIGDLAAATRKFNETEQIRSIFSDAFASEIAQVIDGTKSLSDAFKSMERQIVSSISNIASKNIAKAIFGDVGSTGGASDFFAYLGKLLSGSFANGTNFAPGGLALVGERGPELVNLPRGSAVTPNHKIGGSNVVNINVNVPGGTSRASSDQIAMATGVAVRRAMARIG